MMAQTLKHKNPNQRQVLESYVCPNCGKTKFAWGEVRCEVNPDCFGLWCRECNTKLLPRRPDTKNKVNIAYRRWVADYDRKTMQIKQLRMGSYRTYNKGAKAKC